MLHELHLTTYRYTQTHCACAANNAHLFICNICLFVCMLYYVQVVTVGDCLISLRACLPENPTNEGNCTACQSSGKGWILSQGGLL